MNVGLQKGLQFVGKWEWSNRADGGYTNDPNDPGGETKYGISKRYHPDLDIRNLTLEQALQVYEDEYWNKIDGDNLAYPECIAVFDTAVNLGCQRALRFWRDSAYNLNSFLELRRQYYLGRVESNPTQLKYLNGWLARVNDLSKLMDIEKGP